MAKINLRKIHFSKDEVWKYYFKNDITGYEDEDLIIFSPARKRYQIKHKDYFDGTRLGIPSEVKKYIEEKLRNSQ